MGITTHTKFLMAFIFLGCIGFISILLIVIYQCVTRGFCFCDIGKKKTLLDEEDDDDDFHPIYVKGMPAEETRRLLPEDNTFHFEGSKFEVPMGIEEVPAQPPNEDLHTNPTPVVRVEAHLDDFHMQNGNTQKDSISGGQEGVSQDGLSRLSLTGFSTPSIGRSNVSLDDLETPGITTDIVDTTTVTSPLEPPQQTATSFEASAAIPSHMNLSETRGSLQESIISGADDEPMDTPPSVGPNLQGCNMKILILYSKEVSFLMITLKELVGTMTSSVRGFNYLRVSMALMPDKSFRAKSKLYHVTSDVTGDGGKIVCDENFKISKVGSDTLYGTSLRFRLYGKKKIGRLALVGETCVELGELTQKSGSFETWKTFV